MRCKSSTCRHGSCCRSDCENGSFGARRPSPWAVRGNSSALGSETALPAAGSRCGCWVGSRAGRCLQDGPARVPSLQLANFDRALARDERRESFATPPVREVWGQVTWSARGAWCSLKTANSWEHHRSRLQRIAWAATSHSVQASHVL
mmetsp:Transcript_71660/g.173592  ORF Transcript_71660/g.173592 Transcript_71660/m.173592 type:complete len:148 (+) Transcript_71660:109-552(+)